VIFGVKLLTRLPSGHRHAGEGEVFWDNLKVYPLEGQRP
jgi:hypothetical protein